MSRIPTITECELGNLNPAVLDEDFLSRLTACAEGTHAQLSDGEAAFEARLRALRPVAVPSALQSSLAAALGDTPFAVDDKIVLFNKPSSGTAAAGVKKRTFRFNVAAAAAVALLGTLAAFMVPAETSQGQAAETGGTSGSPPPAFTTAPSLVAPASFSRDPSEARDEGVIWRGKNQPHRVLRMTYMEKVTVMDAAGNPTSVERPRFEYVIIPEKID
jgi:hypothetical protein